MRPTPAAPTPDASLPDASFPDASLPDASVKVAIVLSTLNGAAFLPEQLSSFVAQQGVAWSLYWRDDGSADESVMTMEAFEAGEGAGRSVRVDTARHVGVTGSYMALLRAAVADGAGVVAFSDQDDVWLPEKLLRAMTQLGEADGPALYCSRQVLVDEGLRRLTDSAPIRVRPGFAAALTQNIATGCTVVLNAAAAALVARSVPPPPSLHDWWSYLVVAAAGGRIVADEQPTVLYRQHTANAVGAPLSTRRRAVAAMRRGPGAFMKVFRAQVAALQAQPDLLSPEASRVVAAVAKGLAGTPAARLWALRIGMRRQTWAETMLFRCWFLIG